MLEDKILNGNKIPGCNKMTRPEEIESLSKYLGYIREVQEEHTSLEEDRIGVPGGINVPRIDSLEDRLYSLDLKDTDSPSKLIHESELLPGDKGKKKNLALSNSPESLPGSKKSPESLSMGKENIPGELKEGDLSQEKIDLPKDIRKEKNIDHLPTVQELLEGIKDNTPKSLSGEREIVPGIVNTQEINLSTQLEGLIGRSKEIDSLPETSEKLNLGGNKVSGLSEERNPLPGKTQSPELMESVENIPGEPQKSLKLKNHKEDLPGEREKIEVLPNKMEELQGIPEISELPTSQEKIEGDLIPALGLSTKREGLENIPETRELSNHREDLKNTPETPNLSSSKENLEGEVPRIDSLSSQVEKLEIEDKITGLSTTTEKIEGDKREVEELSGYKETIEGKEDISKLPSGTIPLPENSLGHEDTELSGIQEKLEGTQESMPRELSTAREEMFQGLQSGEIEALEDEAEKLEGDRKEPEKLSTYREDIEIEGDNKLSTYQEKLEGDPKTPESLSEYVENLEGDLKLTEELSDYQEKLEGDPKIPESLSEHVEKLEGDLKSDFEELEDTEIREENKIPGDVMDPEELSEWVEKLEPEPEEVESLSDHVEKLEGDLRADFESLSDYQEKLEPTPEEIEALSDYQEKLEGDPKIPESLSDYQEKLEPKPEDIENLSDIREDIQGDLKLPEELSTHREDIEGDLKRPEALSDYQEELNPKPEEVENLSEYRENIDNIKEIDSLSDYQEKLEPEVEEINSLSDYQEKLEGDLKFPDSLSDYQEKISPEIEEIDSLSDYQEKLEPGVEEIESLSDYQEELNPKPEEVENLSEYRENIDNIKEIDSLSDYQEKLEPEVEEINSLSDYQEKLEPRPEEVEELSNHREKLEPGVEDVESLSDYIDLLDPEPQDVEKLSDYQEKLDPNPEEVEGLSDYIDELNPHPEDVDKLSDYQEKLNPEPEDVDELYDSALQLYPNLHDEPEELYDSALERGEHLGDDKFTALENGSSLDPFTPLERLEPKPEDVNRLSDYQEKLEGDPKLPESLSEHVEELDVEAEEIESLSEHVEELDVEVEDPESLSEHVEELDTEAEEVDSLSDYRENILNLLREENPSVKYKELMKLIQEAKGDYISEGYGEKLESLVEPIEIGDIQKSGNGAVRMSPYQAPGIKLGFGEGSRIGDIDLTSYIRWAAENTVGKLVKGKARSLAMDEAIALLVLAKEEMQKLTKTEPWRLPGSGLGGLLGSIAENAMSGGINGVISDAGSMIAGAVGGGDKLNPINAPEKETKGWSSQATSRYTQLYSGASSPEGGGFLKLLGKKLKQLVLGGDNGNDYTFNANYLQGEGIGVTIEDLCVGTGAGAIETVEELFATLKASPYMSVPDKFTTTKTNGYIVSTLDSNAYWELILEPYLGPDNGFFSFLPAFHEINIKNYELHSVITHYNRWVPAVSFDLQKSKLTSKTLGLYDGEIAFPISMEFMNEFRLTLVDDQYKSWKTFWETVAEVSVYSSNPHNGGYYKARFEDAAVDDTTDYGSTVVDTKHVLPANYKNITWRCRIYVMTPQLSTIKKFDLLLVMKDLIEEYTGDIDGTPGDLTINFSIVGENPASSTDFTPPTITVSSAMKKMTTDDKGYKVSRDIGSTISSGISSIIGVLS